MMITTNTNISPAFSEPIQLLCTLPENKPASEQRNKEAITIILSPPGTADVSLGCYIYAIYDKRKDEVYQTLLNNSREGLYEITKRLAHIVTKKYATPSYVCVNGDVDPMAMISVIKEVLTVLEAQWTA